MNLSMAQDREKNTEKNPFDLFTQWFGEAQTKEKTYPDAMALATVSDSGMPDVRIVLLKKFDSMGFVFFTNYQGKKATDLEFNPKASLCFYWKSLEKQIRISGQVEKVTEVESDDYFESRPHLSKVGAWASKQSEKMVGEHDLEKRLAEYTLKFHFGKVPRPPHWGGYRLTPTRFEFWEERPSRIHRRRQFLWTGDGKWICEKIYP